MSMAKAVVRGSLISAGLAGVLLCASVAQAADGSFVVPGSKAATLESCVEPTDYMRRNHMEVIKHQRDDTVHQGIRSTKHSLAGCVDCHVSYGSDRVPIAISEKDQFCGACHEFTAVALDCFDCHSSVPNGAPASVVIRGSGAGLAWHPRVGSAASGFDGMSPAAAEGVSR
jgi:hypothetical protein